MLSADKDLKWYLCGPMSHIKSFNYPAFDLAAEQLRERGYDIISPSEMDSPEVRAAVLASPHGEPMKIGSGMSWGDFLSRDVKIIADEVDGIMLLPRWYTSGGALLEVFVGLSKYKEFAYFREEAPPLPAQREVIRGTLRIYT